MHSKKQNSIQIILSLVALLVIFAVAIGVTYSWIEGGTTYSMKTEKLNDVKTGALSDKLNNQTILLSPTGTGTADLDLTYDKTRNDFQDLLFTPVSSVNGKDFFVPIAYDEEGDPKTYRAASTNDIGTKFISYKFDVKANEKCYLAFNGQPVFTTNNNAAFRYMITDGTKRYVFSGSNEAITTQGVSNVNGTTSALTTVKTDAYVDNSSTTQNRLFEFTASQTKTIEMSVWLDSASVTENLYGSDVDFQIKFTVGTPLYKYSIYAKTLNANDVAETDGFAGGSIKIGTTTYTAQQNNLTCVEGSSVTLTAVPKDGYDFLGWYSNSSYDDLVSSDLERVVTPKNGSLYYALFKKSTAKTTTIYVEPRTNFDSYNLYVYNDKLGDVIYYSDTWPGTALSLDSETNYYYKYTFDTTNTGDFYAIVSENGADQFPLQGHDGLSNIIGGTYLFTSDNTLISINPDDFVTLNVVSNGNGTAKVNGGSFVKARVGTDVEISAVPDSGYRFVGWYKDSGCYTTIGTGYTTATQTVSLSGSDTNTYTYYAEFIKTYTAKAYSIYNATTTSSTTGGTVLVAGGTQGATSSCTADIGANKSFIATANTGYVFDGWYTAASGGTKVSSSQVYTITNISADATLYGKFLKTYSSTAHAVTNATNDSSTGGTVAAGSSAAGATSATTANYGTNITYVATAKTNYTFDGWYTAATGGTKLSSSTSYTVAAQSSKANVYARFLSSYAVRAYAYSDGANNANGGSVELDVGSTQHSYAYATVNYGKSVTFTATVKDGYKFVGWFTSSSGTTPESTSPEHTVPITQAKTLYAKFVSKLPIYFKPNADWKNDNARFAAYVWIPGGETKWYSMSDGNGDGIYSAEIDIKYTMVIFCRMDPNNTTNNWDTEWNQTGDLTIPQDGNNYYDKSNDTSWNGGTSGTWKKYG